jgi:hypothetical protein
VPPRAGGERPEHRDELGRREALFAVHQLVGEPFRQIQGQPLVRREPVFPHARLRQRSDREGEITGPGERLAWRRHPRREPDRERLVGRHRTPCQDQIERPPEADDPRKSHRPAIDERHAEATTEHAQRRVLGDDT